MDREAPPPQSQRQEAVGIAIEAVETAPFLSEKQKQALLYDNAARFLRLSAEEIAEHKSRSLNALIAYPSETNSEK